MWWLLGAVIFAYVFTSTPKQENAKPAGLGDFEVPTAEIGREIPVIFGTVKMESPNVVWTGDLRTVPIKSSGGKK